MFRRRKAWQPPSRGQRDAVRALTKKHGRQTLVRSRADGSAEVVGFHKSTPYRYVVSPDGAKVDSVPIDKRHWHAKTPREERLGVIGIVLFFGGGAGAFILAPGGAAAISAVIAVVGIGLAVLFASAPNPADLLANPDDWQQVGSGWHDGA